MEESRITQTSETGESDKHWQNIINRLEVFLQFNFHFNAFQQLFESSEVDRFIVVHGEKESEHILSFLLGLKFYD